MRFRSLYPIFLFYFLVAVAFGQQSKVDSLLSILSQQADTNRVNTLNKISEEQWILGDFVQARVHANDALTLTQKINYAIGKTDALTNLGLIEMFQGNFPSALQKNFEALKIAEDEKYKKGIANAYGAIGTIYYDQSNLPEALKNHLKALEIRKEIGDKRKIGYSYQNIGNIYVTKREYPEAIKNYSNAEKLYREVGFKKGISDILVDLANIYGEQNDNNKALDNYNQALLIKKEIGDKKGIANSYLNIAYVSILQKKYPEAKNCLDKALPLLKEIGSKPLLRAGYNTWSLLDSAEGNYKAAYEHHKIYSLYKDSLINEELSQKVLQEKIQSEFDKKETLAKAEQEKKDALAEQEKQLQASREFWIEIICVVIFLSLISIAFILYKRYKAKKITSEQLASKNKIIEEKNKDITDSITYAKRIQQAKLPDKNEIQKSLPNSFVLFKPKDIVSGDFYYFHKNNEAVFIAAADCTGHGVPGAIMSMIGSEKLEDAIYRSADTSEILKQLNKGIKTALHQSDSNESTRDGMDIALCSINTLNCTLKYSGANRPLWIIRKGTSEVHEIKATKKAIGGFTEDSQHFDTHEVKIQQGDTFYIFSDGYADTFSGADGKKLTTKKFKEILLSIQDKSMQEQEQHLNDHIENWKAGTEQVDDILVIGIRL